MENLSFHPTEWKPHPSRTPEASVSSGRPQARCSSHTGAPGLLSPLSAARSAPFTPNFAASEGHEPSAGWSQTATGFGSWTLAPTGGKGVRRSVGSASPWRPGWHLLLFLHCPAMFQVELLEGRTENKCCLLISEKKKKEKKSSLLYLAEGFPSLTSTLVGCI